MEEIKIFDFGHDDTEEKAGRSRNWLLLLYPDNEEHSAVLDGKLDELDWDYCGRIHDEDPGIKPHHHVIVAFKDGRQKADVAADLALDPRWLRRVHSIKKAMRYLCHKDNPEKHQYSADGIYGTIADRAIAQCSKGDAISEQEGVLKVHQIIDNWEGFITVSKLLPVICAEGVYSHYRRLGHSIFRMIEEHNRPLQEEKLIRQRMSFDRDSFAASLDTLDEVFANMTFREYLEWREKQGFSNAPQKSFD